MNISQNEVNDICRKVLSDLQLPGGCQQFVQNIVAGNYGTASRNLEEIIYLSVSKCIYEALRKIK